MQINSKIKTMMETDEGLRLKPYRCTAGRLSVGYGRNLDDVGISNATALQMLQEDVDRAERVCIGIFGSQWDKWSENRQLGWINLAFNLGNASLLGFRNTLRAAILEDWGAVEKNLLASKYATQVGERAKRVIAMICRERFPYG